MYLLIFVRLSFYYHKNQPFLQKNALKKAIFPGLPSWQHVRNRSHRSIEHESKKNPLGYFVQVTLLTPVWPPDYKSLLQFSCYKRCTPSILQQPRKHQKTSENQNVGYLIGKNKVGRT